MTVSLFCLQNEEDIRDNSLSEIRRESVIRFKPPSPGYATCFASNKQGSHSNSGSIMIGDFSEAFALVGLNENDIVAVDDSMTFVCAAAKYNYSNKIEWIKDGEAIDLDKGFHIESVEGKFSYQSRLMKSDLTIDDSGNYACKVYGKKTDEMFLKEQDMTVHPTVDPSIEPSFTEPQMDFMLGEPMRLECKTNGIPVPSISWYKVRF
jgi:hypothetical protein